MILSMQNIQKSFGDLKVLRDISFDVDQGNVVGVIGPSGSGKSTLLRCATLLEQPDGGNVIYEGKYAVRDGVAAHKSQLRQIRQCFGLVFQNFNLFPHYDLLKNVTDAPIHVQGRKPEEAEAEGLELLEKMGLRDKARSYPCQLSGGQQQRAAIARALAMRPDILFFDEPTSALDPELTGDVLRVIRGLAEENMTMVIVTHEMPFARAVADHIIFMDGGVIVEQGQPEQVIGDPREERTRAFLRRLDQ